MRLGGDVFPGPRFACPGLSSPGPLARRSLVIQSATSILGTTGIDPWDVFGIWCFEFRTSPARRVGGRSGLVPSGFLLLRLDGSVGIDQEPKQSAEHQDSA